MMAWDMEEQLPELLVLEYYWEEVDMEKLELARSRSIEQGHIPWKIPRIYYKVCVDSSYKELLDWSREKRESMVTAIGSDIGKQSADQRRDFISPAFNTSHYHSLIEELNGIMISAVHSTVLPSGVVRVLVNSV